MKKYILILSLIIIQQNLLAQKHFVSPSDSLSIDQQLDAHFGVDYEIDDYIFVDSLENNYDRNRETIKDNYGSLDNCIVFTASIKNAYKYVKGIVGVFRANQIIWYSDYIIPDDEIYGGGFITVINDNNNNGIVEIMTEWESVGGASYSTKTLFIHSWDGNQGSLSIDVSSGESPIRCHENKIFDFIDVQGDGVFEIISYSYSNHPTVIEWNGSKYSFSAIKLETTKMFFPRNNFTPIVSTVVNKVDDKFIYKYKVKNSNNSKQSINKFDVYGHDIVYNVVENYYSNVRTLAKKWYGDDRQNSVTWSGLPIKPGENVDGFSYTATGLPHIGHSYLRGYNYQWGGDYEDNHSVYDYLNNSVIVKTIAAKLPLTPFIPTNFLDSLNSYTDSSHILGWIETEQARDKYNTYFNNAKTFLAQTDSASAKVELQKVMIECNIDSSTVLTSEAYALLYFNTEYLIEQLPETNNLPLNSLSGSVQIVVTESETENTFTYNVSNSDTSSQSIESVFISSTSNDEVITAPTNWSEVTETFSYNLAGFKSATEAISPGGSKGGFNISTKGLPTIGNVYLQSQRSFTDSTDIFDNSYVVETIVPRAAPSDFEPISFIDTLLSYNNKSLVNNWFSAAWVLTVLKSSLDNARLMIELDQPQSSLPIMEQFNVILASYKTSNFITDEAYYLLKPNSSYLITKLDSLINAPQNIGAFALLDTVFAAHEKNNNEGWYLYTWVYTNFTAMLNNVKITLEQNNPIGCKGVMEGFVATLDAYKASGFVTEEGHSYLKPKCLNLIEELSN